MCASVCVCMNVCGRVCAHVHVNSSWKSVLVIKNYFLQLVESCQQYLLLRSAYVAAPAFEYSPLKKKCTRLIAFFRCPGLFCCTEIGLLNIMWMYAFSLLKFHQAAGEAYFWSSCELLLGTNLPQVLPPFDIILYFTYSPLIKAKS